MNTNGEKKNFVFRALDKFGDLFAINVAFVICSLPLITIGASLCAMYSMCIKLIKKEDGPLVAGFFREFKRNFKQATLAWIIVLFALVAIWGEFYYAINYAGVMAKMYMVLVVVETVVLALVAPFVFPLIARYENTLWNTFKNAFLLAISNLGKWLKVFLAWFAPIFFSLYEPVIFLSTWYLWLIIAFALIAYGTSHSLMKCFERVSDVKEEKAERAEIERKKHSTNGGIRKRAMMGVEDSDQTEEE